MSKAKLPALPKKLIKTLDEVLAIPTAPFHEHWLRRSLERRFESLANVTTRIDSSGNLWVRYRPKGGRASGLCLQAHLDHPGFVAERPEGKKRYRVSGYGGIPENCRDARIRFFRNPEDKGVLAKITAIKKEKLGYRLTVESNTELPPGSVGMWDFPPLKLRGPWVEGRSFDDTLGVGILVYTLEELVRKKSRLALDIVFTRAEEVGYVGLLDAVKRKSFKLPKRTLTIEMPRAGGELVAGNGVMLRAGDRNVNFDADALLYIEQTAAALRAKHKAFRAQRRLGLFGGTEVGVFHFLGAETSCLCLPVIHGHNIDLTKRGRPAPERVHAGDLFSLVLLLEELLKKPWDVEKSRNALKAKMLRNAKAWSTLLSA